MRTRVGFYLAGAALVGGLLIASAVAADEHPFVGSKKCKMCHVKEFNSWAATEMAKATDVLKPGAAADHKKAAGLDPAKDYTQDKTCLPCHTTGHGKAGGFVDVATTPDLVGVGCESCHGAAGTYLQKEHMSLQNKEYKRADLVKVGLVEKVGEAQCLSCHQKGNKVPGHDKPFDFAKDKAKGTHENVPLKYTH
jgi:hypothetical protein